MSWDDDGSGVLEADEIVKPLVALGLSSDKGFAMKILAALDPRSKAEKADSELRIMLPDFIKIFKQDKVSEALIDVIKKETEKFKAKAMANESEKRSIANMDAIKNGVMQKLKEKSTEFDSGDEGDKKASETNKIKSGFGLLMKAAADNAETGTFASGRQSGSGNRKRSGSMNRRLNPQKSTFSVETQDLYKKKAVK